MRFQGASNQQENDVPTNRIANTDLASRIMDADAAASLISHGMTIGMSGKDCSV